MFNKKNFKIIKNKNIEINTYIDGKGPLVIMAHGWPESGILGDIRLLL